MFFLSVLVLTAGMSAAAALPSSASFSSQAEARLNRMSAAVTAEVSQQALSQALADVTRRNKMTLERRLAAPRPVLPAPRLTAINPPSPMRMDKITIRAKRAVDRIVARMEHRLRQTVRIQARADLSTFRAIIPHPRAADMTAHAARATRPAHNRMVAAKQR